MRMWYDSFFLCIPDDFYTNKMKSNHSQFFVVFFSLGGCVCSVSLPSTVSHSLRYYVVFTQLCNIAKKKIAWKEQGKKKKDEKWQEQSSILSRNGRQS